MQTDAVHFYSVFWKLEPNCWEKYSDDVVSSGYGTLLYHIISVPQGRTQIVASNINLYQNSPIFKTTDATAAT